MPAPDATALLIDDYPACHRARRMAVVTETYPPEINGVSLSLTRLVMGLQTAGHDVQLVRVRQGPQDLPAVADADPAGDCVDPGRMEQVLMRGMPIPHYPNLKMGLPAKSALVRLWRQKRPDMVHIATEGPLGWSALQAAMLLRLPVTSDFRTNFHAYSQHYGVGLLRRPILSYLRKFHNRTDRTMVPTQALKAQLTDLGFKRLTVVSRGVETAQFEPSRRSLALRQRWGADPTSLVVTCVGRLAAEKNLQLVLRAFDRIQEVRPKSRLVLVGDGPMRDVIAQRFPRAVLAGQRRGTELAEHYASADLFLFASLTETFGNVVPEAMASGLAVVAFDCAAAGELISDGRDGRTVPADNEGAFIQAAVELAQDDSRRQAMGAAARESACRHSWPRVVEQFMGVVHAVTAPRAD